jgi:hypothetical protein
MKNQLALFLTLILITSTFQQSVIADCKWASSTYDNVNLIRVIRKDSSDYPINFQCWEREKVKGTIFFALSNCMLAVSDDSGIECSLCNIGFNIQAGACIKNETPAPIPSPK